MTARARPIELAELGQVNTAGVWLRKLAARPGSLDQETRAAAEGLGVRLMRLSKEVGQRIPPTRPKPHRKDLCPGAAR